MLPGHSTFCQLSNRAALGNPITMMLGNQASRLPWAHHLLEPKASATETRETLKFFSPLSRAMLRCGASVRHTISAYSMYHLDPGCTGESSLHVGHEFCGPFLVVGGGKSTSGASGCKASEAASAPDIVRPIRDIAAGHFAVRSAFANTSAFCLVVLHSSSWVSSRSHCSFTAARLTLCVRFRYLQ